MQKRIVKTFSTDPQNLQHAKEMAREESRSFSNFIVKLINDEWERRQKAGQEQNTSTLQEIHPITMDEAAARG